MNKCGGCGKFLSGGAACSKCNVMYHKQCVNIVSSQTPKNWLCPCCTASAPRKDNTNTPLKEPESRRLESELGKQVLGQSPQRTDGGGEQVQNLVLEEIRALRSEMNSFRSELGSFRTEVRDEMRDLRALYQGCNSKMEFFSERLDNQETMLARLEASSKQTQDLKAQIYSLKQEQQIKEQTALQFDIEISGVTEHNGENVMHVAGLLMNKIGSEVDERDIVQAHRVGPVRVGQDGKQRPRPIIMRVTRRAVHEQVLRCARARRNITTSDLDLAGTPRPVYINERLTKEYRLLFNKARSLCKQHGWRYAWTREGKILVRESDGKTAFRVRCEEDLEKHFQKPLN